MSKPRVDLTGNRYGRLVVEEYLGSREYSGKIRGFWRCKCDCGCGQREAASIQGKATRTHGLRDTKEYSCWVNMVSRSTNPNTPEYDIYHLRGIDPLWEKSFSIFIEHIGMMPVDGKKYSIERVDNTIGYFPGNVIWLERRLQSRNQSRRKDNNSGVTGVHFSSGDFDYWTATWCDVDGKSRSKSFSVKKLGFDESKRLAIEYRNRMLEELKCKGVFYSATHGVPRLA